MSENTRASARTASRALVERLAGHVGIGDSSRTARLTVVPQRPTFAINVCRYDVVELELDSTSYRRAYRATWDGTKLRVLGHWSDDCVEHTGALPMPEWRELERFVDASDVVADELVNGGRL
jgi:hypothetical protein